MINSILRKWQVVFWGVSVFVALLLVFNIIPVNKGKGWGLGNGLDYGLDFAGGIQLQLRLDRPVDADTMAVEKGILENRLNSLGLKDIPVRSWGDQYILIQVAGASPDEIASIESILRQQARFEERIDGELAVKGDEIAVDLAPGGSRLYSAPNGYTWEVAVKHSPEGACRFGRVGDGRKGRPVDIFIDRPENTSVLMSDGTYALLENFTSSGGSDDVMYGDPLLFVVENRSRLPVVRLDSVQSSIAKLVSMKKDGYDTVILAGGEDEINESVRNMLEEAGLKTARKSVGSNESQVAWVMDFTGLKSSPRLNFETRGECIYSALITGGTSTLTEAKNRVKENQVLLTSGNLPAKATIESKSTTPPALGMKFLDYSLYIGLFALLTVGVIIYLRYKRIDLSIPIMLTDVSEVLIVLGLAAMIHWNLDLPSIAGIIAAVGTGVNDQIVMTDEALLDRGRRSSRKEFYSVSGQIKKAFSIIFTAAATIVAAMIPILSIGAGMLKGFAFTTIMGVIIGVFITRQGYAAVVREVLKE